MSRPRTTIRAALLQQLGSGRLMPEIQSIANALSRRGVPFDFFLEKRLSRGQLDLQPDVLVAGHIPIVVQSLRRLGVEPPPPNDYPQSLRPWLHRRVWRATVRDVVARLQEDWGAPFFVKPAGRLNRFTGAVVRSWNDMALLANVPDRMPVLCSEVVTWLSEHRVYVREGTVLGIRHYLGDASIPLDESVTSAAVQAFAASGEAPAGYGIDFGVLADGRTALVEVNDGYGLGSYGLDDDAYADLIIARWCQLADGTGSP